MTLTSEINCSIDFDADGKQFGSLNLTFSDNEHAFANIPIPLVVIKNGSGPTLLLSAGNHGDEHEGQVILRKLIYSTKASDIHGRLIILPALNYPAVLANSRISPLDQGNLNRSFPGTQDGPPTAAIAHYVSSQILPMCDAGIDLHSGGSSSSYLPMAFLCHTDNDNISSRNLALAEAFNAPYTYAVRGSASARGFDPVAHTIGVPFISAELGGGGPVVANSVDIGSTGIHNVMQFMGIMKSLQNVQPRTRFINGVKSAHYLSAAFSGIFESRYEPGEWVEANDVAGYLYALEEIDRAPLELRFDAPGLVLVRCSNARVKQGSHLYLSAGEMSRNDVLSAKFDSCNK